MGRRVRWWRVLAAVVALGLMVLDIPRNVPSKPKHKHQGAVWFWPKWFIVLVVSAALGAGAGYLVACLGFSQWLSPLAGLVSLVAFVASAGTANLFKPKSPETDPFPPTTQRVCVMVAGPFALAFGLAFAF